MKILVMLSLLFSILGCSGNNTLELRFEQGRAIFWPQWKKSLSEDLQPHNFLIGLPEKPARSLKGFTIILKNGLSLTLSSPTLLDDIDQSLSGIGKYDVSEELGPAIHPGKSYFEWPPETTAVYKNGVLTAFFASDQLLAISIDNESDALDRIVFNEDTFSFPLKLADLKVILGSPIERDRYLSQ
jgi:hypothetical protein